MTDNPVYVYSLENLIGIYGDSRENISEMLADFII